MSTKKNTMTDKEGPVLVMTDQGLALQSGGQQIPADLTKMLPRLRQANLQEEMLLRAARIRVPGRPV